MFKVTSPVYPKWFYYQWIKFHLLEFKHIAQGKATTMGHIQRHHLSETLVIVPPKKIPEKMSAVMDSLMNKFINNNLESQVLILIRDSLLPKLMAGKIRVEIQEVKNER